MKREIGDVQRIAWGIRGIFACCSAGSDVETMDIATASADPRAIVALRRCVSLYGEHDVYIIARCLEGEDPDKIKRWLHANDVFGSADFSTDNIRLCRNRREQAEMASDLEITHMVLRGGLDMLAFGRPHIVTLTPSQRELDAYRDVEGLRFTIAGDWDELNGILRRSGEGLEATA